MRKMRKEKQIVTWSLVTLFLSLTIVYALTYMRKTEVFKLPSQEQKQKKADEDLLTGTGASTIIQSGNTL
jgi:hypothetical protein